VEGVAGAWTPLATLVRLPKFTGVDCPAEPDSACLLSGRDLFLVDSVSVDADFTRATRVPDGFTAPTLHIAHPLQGRLYVKLRDDPAIVSVVVLNVKTAPPASAEAAPPAPAPGHTREPTPQPAITAAQTAPVSAPAPEHPPEPTPQPAVTAPPASAETAPPAPAPEHPQEPTLQPAITAAQTAPVHAR
jgi:hypothetical protein